MNDIYNNITSFNKPIRKKIIKRKKQSKINVQPIQLHPSFNTDKIFYISGCKSTYKTMIANFFTLYGEVYEVYESKPSELKCFLKNGPKPDQWKWETGYWIPPSYQHRISVILVYDEPNDSFPYEKNYIENYISGEHNLNYEIMAIQPKVMEYKDYKDLMNYLHLPTDNIKNLIPNIETIKMLENDDNDFIDVIDVLEPFTVIPSKK
jgi:hypothetical protein